MKKITPRKGKLKRPPKRALRRAVTEDSKNLEQLSAAENAEQDSSSVPTHAEDTHASARIAAEVVASTPAGVEEPSANEKPSADQESPSAIEEPSVDGDESSADQESPSANEE
ncbi:MAG: hypothetical protein HWE11_07565, partial [Gammaproteobacteria bacterium]|nr:hypothetical protein [Gammaproteobacteria bacterium]